MGIFGGTFGEEFYFGKNKEEMDMGANFEEVKDFMPEEINDETVFKPLDGAFECRIDRLARVQGNQKTTQEPYDFYSLSAEIVTVVDGEKGLGRYLNKNYNNDNEGIRKLLNDMFTSGIELDKSSQEAFDLSLSNAKDKIIKIRAWIWKPEKDRSGNIIPEMARKERQQLKVVKKFKLGKETGQNESPKASEVPF